MIKATSMAAYEKLKQAGKIGEQQLKIIKAMAPNTIYTRRQLAMITGIETSTVSARVNSMLNTFIEVEGKVKDPITNIHVEAIKLRDLDLVGLPA